jgi:hypothetical protein
VTRDRIPPRLHALLARDASTAVVVRRGPSRHTALIGWDRRTDRFELGQWLYGRFYERRADLSPDGRHLIYFAMNGRWSSTVKGSWTAVSRAPYLKAIALFAKGDCWHGGGLFESDRTYWLNDGYGHEVLAEAPGLERSARYPWHEPYGGECPGVYYIRLQRDGWTMGKSARGRGQDAAIPFDKPIDARWTLRKHAHASIHRKQGRSVYFDTHELVDSRSGRTQAKPGWEWADVDGRRLVWAEEGRLMAGRPDANGNIDGRTLFDSSPMQFERRRAPY